MKRPTAADVERATASVEWSGRPLMLKRATAADNRATAALHQQNKQKRESVSPTYNALVTTLSAFVSAL